MNAPNLAPGSTVLLDSVLCTDELQHRPTRPPDYQAENKALLAMAQELTRSPGSVLQRLVEVVLELCQGQSAGISLLEEGPPGSLSSRGSVLRWHAVAGQWAPLVWETTTPRDFGPCGTVLDRNATLLFLKPHRYFPQFVGVEPMVVEALLAPFYLNGQPVGTVWVVVHDEGRKFDAEDQRMLESVATFAAAAYQIRLSNLAHTTANQALHTEIVERQRAEQALHDADRHKSEFLAMLAHELRNPLAPIRNALAIMRLSAGNEETRKPAMEMMERQVSQVIRLVDDLLDASRISRGKIELRMAPVELASIVHHAVEAARPNCEGMGHELTVSLPRKPIYLHADPLRLAQVIGNLLNNASKFTAAGGRITLSVELQVEQAIIRVSDNGIGIAADHLGRIFDMFVQVDSSIDRTRDGLGIGLTLVKNLTELHGGQVEVESDGVGQGSRFVVRLPALAEAPRPAPEPPASLPTQETPPLRILVVDDNEDSADSIAMLLRFSGNETHTAYDGVQAVEATVALRPDVVLLDLGMPRMNGYEAARRIREQPWSNGIVLVALTGLGQDEDRLKTSAAGFNGHMVKPVDHLALLKMLAELVAH